MTRRYTAAHWGSYRIEGEALVPVDDDPAPSRIGKGWVSAARDPASRILRPAVRKGWLAGDGGTRRCNDGFVEVSWERAIALATGELDRVRSAHGNGAIFAGSYGWASAGRFHHAQSQMRRFLNLIGGYVGARDTYSHAAAEVLFPHITGLSLSALHAQSTTWPLIAEHCELLVAFGGISARTAQIDSAGTSRHELGDWLDRLKAQVVNVSPQRSDLEGAEWLSLRPGTDTALILALCTTLLEEGLHDEAFLTRYTSGWPQFRAYLAGEADGLRKSADWAAPICGLPAESIRSLARDMARSRCFLALAWGLQRADHGEQPLWAGLALASMLGQIGQPGTGFGFGYGSTAPIGRPHRLYPWPSLPQGSNPISDFIPVARVADMFATPGGAYLYNGESRRYPDIRLVYWVGGNPFHHHQDLNRLNRLWTRPDTVIVQDHSWTATARRADIVLPATSPLERSDIMMNKRDPSLVYMSPVFAPMGEAQDDHEIFRRMAAHMGVEAAFTEGRSAEDWLRRLWLGATDVAAEAGVNLPDFDTFREIGRFDMPGSHEDRCLFETFIANPEANPLATESGRITLFNDTIAAMSLDDCPPHPAWRQPVESVLEAPAGALALISPQPDTRLHSQNDRGKEALSDKIVGREPCRMHPDTAAERGITEDSLVRIFNTRGACLAGARLDEGVRRDCLVLPTGAWFDPGPEGAPERAGNPNVLTRDKGCSGLSQGNTAHTALVFVEPWTGSLPSLTTVKPPILDPDD